MRIFRILLKFLCTLAVMLCAAQYVNAVPAYPKPIEYKQPDGTTVTLTLKGDEHLSWAVTPDDCTLLPNEEKYTTAF